MKTVFVAAVLEPANFFYLAHFFCNVFLFVLAHRHNSYPFPSRFSPFWSMLSLFGPFLPLFYIKTSFLALLGETFLWSKWQAFRRGGPGGGEIPPILYLCFGKKIAKAYVRGSLAKSWWCCLDGDQQPVKELSMRDQKPSRLSSCDMGYDFNFFCRFG